jgi:hypothetical protein
MDDARGLRRHIVNPLAGVDQSESPMRLLLSDFPDISG